MGARDFLAPPLPGRVHAREGARVGGRMDADAAFELVIGQLAERRGGIQLFVLCDREQDLVLIGQVQQRVGMPAAFQDGGIQGAHQRFGGGGGFDGHPVTGFDLRRVVHQDFCKLFNTRISQKNLLNNDQIISLQIISHSGTTDSIANTAFESRYDCEVTAYSFKISSIFACSPGGAASREQGGGR